MKLGQTKLLFINIRLSIIALLIINNRLGSTYLNYFVGYHLRKRVYLY